MMILSPLLPLAAYTVEPDTVPAALFVDYDTAA
jgi:hypothetical protein